MAEIPEALRAFLTITLDEADGTYRIEIPTSVVEAGALAPGDACRIAILGHDDRRP